MIFPRSLCHLVIAQLLRKHSSLSMTNKIKKNIEGKNRKNFFLSFSFGVFSSLWSGKFWKIYDLIFILMMPVFCPVVRIILHNPLTNFRILHKVITPKFFFRFSIAFSHYFPHRTD